MMGSQDLAVPVTCLDASVYCLDVAPGFTLGATQQYFLSPTGEAGNQAVVADFNGDGNPDVAVAGNGYINILLGKGDGTFVTQNPYFVSGVRDDGKWKRAFHARAAIVDPKATLAKSVDRQQALNEANAQPTNRNARTDAMLAVERSVWEAWRAHDAKKLADLTARDISFINIFGVYLATKTDAMQDCPGLIAMSKASASPTPRARCSRRRSAS
jgi:hypothetical protein